VDLARAVFNVIATCSCHWSEQGFANPHKKIKLNSTIEESRMIKGIGADERNGNESQST
jgi:hypothetical protein